MEQVGLHIEGHQVTLVEEVGLMVEMNQVSPDNQVDPKQDHRVVLVAQSFFHTEHTIVAVVQEVVPVVYTFPPQEHKTFLVEADLKDCRVAPIGQKVDLADCKVVPVDQRVVPARLKVVPVRVVLVRLRVVDE